MTLEQSEGYLIALQDIKNMIEERIKECEYALSESYSYMMERNNHDQSI